MSSIKCCPRCGAIQCREAVKECIRCEIQLIETPYDEDLYWDKESQKDTIDKIYEEYVYNNPLYDETAFKAREQRHKSIYLGDGIPLNSNKQNIPKCPTCQSTNIQKLSTTSKVLGVGLLGLASKTVGKTMKCKSCGYHW